MKHLMTGTLLLASSATAHAEVLAAAPDHYELKQEAVSTLTPGELWDRLIHPEVWWHPDHTFSGASEHLSLDLSPKPPTGQPPAVSANSPRLSIM